MACSCMHPPPNQHPPLLATPHTPTTPHIQRTCCWASHPAIACPGCPCLCRRHGLCRHRRARTCPRPGPCPDPCHSPEAAPGGPYPHHHHHTPEEARGAGPHSRPGPWVGRGEALHSRGLEALCRSREVAHAPRPAFQEERRRVAAEEGNTQQPRDPYHGRQIAAADEGRGGNQKHTTDAVGDSRAGAGSETEMGLVRAQAHHLCVCVCLPRKAQDGQECTRAFGHSGVHGVQQV